MAAQHKSRRPDPASKAATPKQMQGLSTEEAQRRLAQYGANAIREERVSAVRKLLTHFWGPIPWTIEAAAVLSGVTQRWEDFIVILVMLLINAGVGFFEEYKADTKT